MANYFPMQKVEIGKMSSIHAPPKSGEGSGDLLETQMLFVDAPCVNPVGLLFSRYLASRLSGTRGLFSGIDAFRSCLPDPDSGLKRRLSAEFGRSTYFSGLYTHR